MFAASASCVHLFLRPYVELLMLSGLHDNQNGRPHHVLSDQLLELEHDTLSVRDWCALPGRKRILGRLNSLLELAIRDDWHPGNHFLRGLHDIQFFSTKARCMHPGEWYCSAFQPTYWIGDVDPFTSLGVSKVPIDQHFGGPLRAG